MTLPAGWILRVSRSKGKVFYYNTHTQETQWTRPTEGAAPAAANDERKATKRKREDDDEADAVITPITSTTNSASPGAGGDGRRAAIARCMRVGASSGGKAFAPWDHQVDAVENLVDALENPNGSHAHRFLLQHSTGSGKTVTIAALTHQLLHLQDANDQRFHTVVLLIDRIKLDEQVGDSVERFLRRNGVDAIHRATSIDHLASLLSSPDSHSDSASRQRVIITTIQKIGLLAKNSVLLTRLLHGNTSVVSGEEEKDSYSRIGIITDEAHRSHTAGTRQTIEAVMNAGDSDSGDNPVTFVGFTATPNTEALRLFGSPSKTQEGVLTPFHCYTMSRAVEDGRIVDVLQNYKSVRCELEISVPVDVQQRLMETNTMRTVMDAASDDVDVLKAKSGFMMKDFEAARTSWRRAKCMIVTRSRRDVVRYHELIRAFVQNRRLPWRVFAVFSGTVTTENTGAAAGGSSRTVTEQSLNAKHLTLASSDIVIVCDKLDTGYSDPLLACMYIDRYLRSSVQTVQLLSRLNRLHPEKQGVRIVDFANHVAQIRRHFATFWEDAKTSCDGDRDIMRTADWRTAVAIADSMIPKPDGVSKPKYVAERTAVLIRTLDRDAFQQLFDAVRLGVTTRTSMERDDSDEAKSAFSHKHFNCVKSALEDATSPTDDPALYIEEIVSKMKTRVKQYEVLFTGRVVVAELHSSPSPVQYDTQG